ncbi:MAG: cell division protein FtsL [Acidobacteria bacterium]|nr:cell division protein FtsL [Acidobacteriota bacterium]
MGGRAPKGRGGRRRSRLVAARRPAADFWFGRPVDNSALVRIAAPRRRRHYGRLFLCGFVVFLFALAYGWQHFQYIRFQYRIADLKAEETKLIEWNHKLRLEKSSLERLERVEAIATKQLGLQRARPEQVIFIGPDSVSSGQVTLAENFADGAKRRIHP